MTVAELIEKLRQHPPTMLVESEGAEIGGYDVEVGLGVYLEQRQVEYFGRQQTVLHIAHEGGE